MAVTPGRVIERVESSRRIHRADALDIASCSARLGRDATRATTDGGDEPRPPRTSSARQGSESGDGDACRRGDAIRYPWCTVGRVRSGYMPNFDVAIHNGTGVLVGANLMLTASHLAPWAHGPEGWWMEFTPAFNAQHPVPVPFGRSFVDSYRRSSTLSDGSPGGTDYVICKLYDPLGKGSAGWARAATVTRTGPRQAIRHRRLPLRLPGGPIVDFDIYIKDIDGDGSGLELEVLYAKAFGGGLVRRAAMELASRWIGCRVYGIKSGWEWMDRSTRRAGCLQVAAIMVELVMYGACEFGVSATPGWLGRRGRSPLFRSTRSSRRLDMALESRSASLRSTDGLESLVAA